MGDTFKEVEAGLELASRWLPKLLGIFGLLTRRGVPPQEAAHLIDDHLEQGRPNLSELDK